MTLNPVTTLMMIWLVFGLSMWAAGLVIARHWERRNHLLFLRTSLRQSLERGRDNMPVLEPIALGPAIGTARITWRSRPAEVKTTSSWPIRERSFATAKPLLLGDATRTASRTA